jgi:L,D-peptidoglycan transpeptidase YkuD (ErfK/YbiS/YcfS/YnhG family)
MTVLEGSLKPLLWAALIAATCTTNAAAANFRTTDARQLVLVVTPDWDATQGVMRTFERHAEGWVPRREEKVSIGRSGAAWGIGLHDAQPGLQKKEGDGRSPAGMFSIGPAFGYDKHVVSQLPYQAMTQFDYCIDVNESPLYNRIVDSRKVGAAAVAQSTEPMRRDLHAKGDQRYALGFVVEHNPQNVPTRGSCIFAHLWGAPGQTTAGCTATTSDAMRDLVLWLDPDQKPIFALLPWAEYERLKGAWKLPLVKRPQ